MTTYSTLVIRKCVYFECIEEGFKLTCWIQWWHTTALGCRGCMNTCTRAFRLVGGCFSGGKLHRIHRIGAGTNGIGIMRGWIWKNWKKQCISTRARTNRIGWKSTYRINWGKMLSKINRRRSITQCSTNLKPPVPRNPLHLQQKSLRLKFYPNPLALCLSCWQLDLIMVLELQQLTS